MSTGTGRHYCEDGDCGVAVTPSGSFRIERRIRGQHKSPLGVLFDPLFFTGGYAIHGTPVYVFGGRTAPTPLPPNPPPSPPAQPAPTQPAPDRTAPSTTTTTQPPTPPSTAGSSQPPADQTPPSTEPAPAPSA